MAELEDTTLDSVFRSGLIEPGSPSQRFQYSVDSIHHSMKNHNQISWLVSLIKNLDFAMLTEAEQDSLSIVDPSDEKQLIQAIKDYVVPEFMSWDAKSRDIVRESLSAALASEKFVFDAAIRNLEFPFGELPDSRKFFRLIEHELDEVS